MRFCDLDDPFSAVTMPTNCISEMEPIGPLTVPPMEAEGEPLTSTSGAVQPLTFELEGLCAGEDVLLLHSS